MLTLKYFRKTIAICVGIAVFLFLMLLDVNSSYSVKNRRNHDKTVRAYPDNSSLITNVSSGTEVFTQFDRAVNSFVHKWNLAGASLAIAKDGRLLYAKGYGFANKEEGIEAQPYHLYRIASVSKLITAAAVMKLVEEGKLSMHSKLFGSDGLLDEPRFQNYADTRVEHITVENLLNHSAGWTTRWGDHLFINQTIARELGKNLPVTQEDILVFALSKRLHFAPSSHSSYNNIGYLILQLAIEKIAGMPYETYVKKTIFEPLNIHDAFLAFNFDSLRYHNEVRYYEVNEAEKVKPFDGATGMVMKSRGGNDIRTLGAAGGWIISTVSLVKFLLAIDADDSVEDILSRGSVHTLVNPASGFQPLGWRWIRPNGKWWRSGSFPGSSALAVIRNDGFTYVFLTNSSPWIGAKFPYEVDRFLDRTMGLIGVWPEGNLFELQPSGNLSLNKWEFEIADPYLRGKMATITDKFPPVS